MDAPVKKTKQRGPKKKTGDKPGAAAKVTPEQVCPAAIFVFMCMYRYRHNTLYIYMYTKRYSISPGH